MINSLPVFQVNYSYIWYLAGGSPAYLYSRYSIPISGSWQKDPQPFCIPGKVVIYLHILKVYGFKLTQPFELFS